MLHKRSLCKLEYICSKLNLNCGRERAAFNLCLVNGNTWLLMLRHHWCEQHAWNKTLCLLEAGSNAMLAMRAIVLHTLGWNSYSEASCVFYCEVISWKGLLANHISLYSWDWYVCDFVILYETFVIGYLVEETCETVGVNKNMDSLLQK